MPQCLFHYEREYAVLMRRYSTFTCIDDKHSVKIWELDASVATAERGRQVFVHSGTWLEAADHDFTKFSIIPSVVLVCDIPDEVCDSWYTGDVIMMLKEGAFKPLSPLCHSTELSNILGGRMQDKPVLFVYSDGGSWPPSNIQFNEVSVIALFRKLNLDYLCAVRTACITHTENLLRGSCLSLILVFKLLPLHERACQRRRKPKLVSAIPWKCLEL